MMNIKKASKTELINYRINQFNSLKPDIITDDITKFLVNNGFFTAPASTKYHGSYEGGLFDHSFAVAKTLMKLTNSNNLIWQRPESPFIVGMFHDLCKIDNYKLVEVQGLESYEYNDDALLKGHGEKSIMILSTLIQLTTEEVMCIRYHMGAFTNKEEWGDYTRAVKHFPNVLWTHHADMITSQILNK